MTLKAYKDITGCYICSDDVIFDENKHEEYKYNDWLLSPEEYYMLILKENQYIVNQLISEFK